MEIISSIVAGLMLFALTLVWAWTAVLNWLWLRPKKLERSLRQQGLRGNPYRFPFGDIKESSKMSRDANSRPIGLTDDIVPRLHSFGNHSVNTYGKDSFTWMGPTPVVNIMNPDQIKEIFFRTGDFLKPRPPPAVKLLLDGLVNLKGEEWAIHRKIMNQAFHLEKLKLLLPAFHSCCNEMLTRWEKSVPSHGKVELDAWPDLENLTLDMISVAAFGGSIQEGKRMFELQRELVQIVIESLQTLSIPGWRFLPTKSNKKMKSLNKEVESLLHGIISKRDKAMRAGEASENDLLGYLLESNMKAIREQMGKNKSNVGMSIEDVIKDCKHLYFAGQVPTSILLGWTIVLLSIHLDWQNRARDEVLQIFGREKPKFDGLNSLKIVTMILYEVLRLYPPALYLLRTVQKDTKLGNLTIPAGAFVTMPSILVHHDQELWGDDAKEFKPDRFSEGLSKATSNPMSYFPFGLGPRKCVAQIFALLEVKMAVAMILQRFSFELSPSYAHAPISVLTPIPQFGIQIVLHKY